MALGDTNTNTAAQTNFGPTNIVSSNVASTNSTGTKVPPRGDVRFGGFTLDTRTLTGALILAVIVAFAAWLVGRLVRLAVHRALNRPKHVPSDPTAIQFMGQFARVGVYIFALILYARLVPALDKVGTGLLASVGVVSVVFGLAAQNTLGNLIAGICLLLYRPYNLGDRLQVTAPTGLETGVVESLNLGYTILRTMDERHVVIPNSLILSQTSINLTSGGGRVVCSVPINVSPEADLEKVRKILMEIAAKFSKPEDYVGSPVTALSSSSMTLNLQVWCRDYQAGITLKSNLLEAVRKRFKEEGIELK
jgi:small conductance mechanosensitive channel